jgi:isopenicillin N synthase-like dioxygenase
MSDTTPDFVPLIDLGAWYEGDDASRSRLAAEVDRAARTSGFLLIVNHGVPEELRLRFRALLDAFFELPTDVKSQYATTVGGHGWTPIGSEANGYSEGTATPPDLKEGFNFGHGSWKRPAPRGRGRCAASRTTCSISSRRASACRTAASGSTTTVRSGSRAATSIPAPT